MRWEKPIVEPVALPADALAGQGGVQVALSPSLTAGLDGVREWMRDYPYTCLEQRVSRAVALGDPVIWNSIAADLPSVPDADGLLKYFPSMHDGSDILTSYVFCDRERGRADRFRRSLKKRWNAACAASSRAT